LQINLQKFCG